MNFYLKIAGKYFKHFEGRHLYPSWGNFRVLLWFLSLGVWMYSLWYFATTAYAADGAGAFPYIVVPEVIWLGITFWIRSWKDDRVIEATNRELGSNLKSMDECRLHMLRSVTGKNPSEFLEVAQEIDDLVSLKRKFRKNSDLTWAELMRSIYNSDSKARLLTLAVVLVSTTVALSVRSDATLDTVFDLFTTSAGQGFLLSLALVGSVLFFGLVGLRVFFFTITEAVTSWSIKFWGEKVSPDWLLSYLVRNLVTYHGSDDEADEKTVGPDITSGDGICDSNVVAIDSARQPEVLVDVSVESEADAVSQNASQRADVDGAQSESPDIGKQCRMR